MFFIGVARLLAAAGLASLLFAVEHRRTWRAWLPLLGLGLLALYGAAYLYGAPFLA